MPEYRELIGFGRHELFLFLLEHVAQRKRIFLFLVGLFLGFSYCLRSGSAFHREAFYTALRIKESHFSGVKRVARGADVHNDRILHGPRLERITAPARNGCLVIPCRMDTCFHRGLFYRKNRVETRGDAH
ncbi:MAG: hypothetical protein UX35_C0001G0061 [Microgenomates group bacterium GW2011_GWA1_46_15]|nr:MAG: hypothetical protein UX00_C0003G0030 [Microgenomates group bacterium GW2011_GWB1_45_17]KKU24164.1 MAG: hypothetical protein UX36_C0002G0147 [Microgenomates group bacterium GW2011_GWC1_46_15]KKU24879.1 MAG: hypothetical protein UX35_C0001G0061 [Microgenomates group bacterium GW2011_GWA1_46_15]